MGQAEKPVIGKKKKRRRRVDRLKNYAWKGKGSLGVVLLMIVLDSKQTRKLLRFW